MTTIRDGGDGPIALRDYNQVRLRGVANGLLSEARRDGWGIAFGHKINVGVIGLRRKTTEAGAGESLSAELAAVDAAVDARNLAELRAALASYVAAVDGDDRREIEHQVEPQAPAKVVELVAPEPEPVPVSEPPLPPANDNHVPVREQDDPDRAQDDPARDQVEGFLTARTQQTPIHIPQIGSVEDIGKAVKMARAEKGWSQQDVADAAGVGRRFVVELETGKASAGVGLVLAVCSTVGLKLALIR